MIGLGEVGAEQLQRDILRPVQALDIPIDELIVVGGAAMQIYGLKRTRDIDVVVTSERLGAVISGWEQDLWYPEKKGQLARRGVQLVFHKFGAASEIEGTGSEYAAAQRGRISFMLAPNDHLYQTTFKELHEEAENFEGVLVSPLQRIAAWKAAVGREKDKRDLLRIQAAVGS